MKPEIEAHFQKRLDDITKSFRDMAEDQTYQYALSVMKVDKREELTKADIDRAFLALGMSVASELEERKSHVVATDIA